jgi:ABC-type multidrug transport system ATPase subunit
LLDEPTIGMDIQGKALFHELLRKAIDDNKTVIVASNDSRILPLFDRITVISDLSIKLDGTPLEVLYQLEKTTQLLPNQVVRIVKLLNEMGHEIPPCKDIHQLNAFLNQ